MAKTRNNRNQARRRSVRGPLRGGFGFHHSKDVWSFGVCKMIIDEIDSQPPAGVKKNWREALIYIAERMRVTPEVLYNRLTPAEVLEKFFKGHLLKWPYFTTTKYSQFADVWARIRRERDEALEAGGKWGQHWVLNEVPLPGKEKTEAQRQAEEAAAEKRGRLAWLQEQSEFEGEPWYERRKKELEDGDSICCTEECEERWNDSADPGLCLAARKGEAKRAAKREERLKARARKQALNANAQERWSYAQAELVALAARYANNPKNFSAVLNGVRKTYNKKAKKGEVRPVFEPGTGMGITRGQYGFHALLGRANNWQAPPQQEGDFMNSQGIKEIMAIIFEDFPVSGPNKKKHPEERALYDKIAKGLKAVRYEKGYEDPDTHKPQLDIYFQALSRGKKWKKNGKVPAEFLPE